MFDSPDNMRLSRQYFSVLQLLRIADLWIDENVAEWERFKRTMIDRIKETKREYQDNYKPLQSFDEQVDKVNQLLHMQAKQLKERIARKTEDVKSLRDGLFNATSLREAMKGMALNRAIYVFTAVTIVYTPLGFMTVSENTWMQHHFFPPILYRYHI
ncbi:hypothetical protein BD289DRAFT_369053 [Coniella lustricola]|uniref:Uncharacterized protein n=1 Tax=Coniella lustricola TaxID=2025994 RepID=A0A2T3A750_9PEZI|nr:hypothetical protein BD289DRAFT_369053 [Coniella lustricola]